jgi:hypothetical protein
LKECRAILDSIYDGKDWSLFLETNTPISVSRSVNQQFNFSLSIPGKEVASSQLRLNQMGTLKMLTLKVDRLRLYVELCFTDLAAVACDLQS